jgi:hypothetical protein
MDYSSRLNDVDIVLYLVCNVWKDVLRFVGNLFFSCIFHCFSLNIQGDSKLLSGFPWPIIFKLETTK